MSNQSMNLAAMRREYARAALDEASASEDPVAQLEAWLQDAARAEVIEPTAMTLATVDAAGRPSARVVLLKELSPSGLVFFTDYRSRKGRELAATPQAGVVFYWGELERQVRAGGTVERLDDAASERYFRSRPEGSRIGAWASEQSSELPDGRPVLEARVAEAAARFRGGEIPRPSHWGGFRLIPDEFEFWQGRPDRLHDRLHYGRTAEGGWRRVRLSP